MAAPGDDVIVVRGRGAGTRGRVVRRSPGGAIGLLVGSGAPGRPVASFRARDVAVVGHKFGNTGGAGGNALRLVDQGISPLCEAGAPAKIAPENLYHTAREVYRLGLVDPTAPPASDFYFTDKERVVRYVKGRALKKPRTYVVPGAAPGTVAFVDFHPYGQDALYIAYIAVRPDMRGRKLGNWLMHGFYENAMKRGIKSVNWGEVMNEHAWAIMKKMQTDFPSIDTRGKYRF